MLVLAYALLILGCMLALLGTLRILVIAYRHGLAWLLACLSLPLSDWIFFLCYLKETWRAMALTYASLLIAVLGQWLGGAAIVPGG
jgi:hypothetical protein